MVVITESSFQIKYPIMKFIERVSMYMKNWCYETGIIEIILKQSVWCITICVQIITWGFKPWIKD